jgi:4-diphosphocytidyl-2-C-methyl-D-erythritol kinase
MPLPNNKSVKLRANAKINLSLKVSSKRQDGYHDIDSVMQSISLHDEIEVKPADHGIKVNCTPHISPNIAEKAAKTLLDELKLVKGVDITINKHIPMAAGLAGGSSDAAAVLIGMNIVLGLNLHKHILMEIGAKIGADVPFCLNGGTCRVMGIGEKVERLDHTSGDAFLLVFPKIEVSTKTVYDKFDEVGAGDTGNDLEKAAISIAPEIKTIKDSLISSTGGAWKMSGSGPTLFLELLDLSDADKYTDKLKELKLNYQVVVKMDAGVEVISE